MLRQSDRPAREVISIGAFRLFPAQRMLTRHDEPVKLGSRAFDLLLALSDRAGEVISQRELIARVWPNLFVEDISLRVHIAALRKVFDCDGTRYLANVPGRGYTLVAPVSRAPLEESESGGAIEPAFPVPRALGRMVGRSEDVREICEELLAKRFVTIVGPGGVGKTTVALSVAHALLKEFLGAVCFVELSPVGSPDVVAATVTSAFRVPVQAQDPIAELIAHLQGKRVLLVLDSCEHVLAAAAVVAERLFAEIPGLHILATSREALRTEGEQARSLPPLASPPEDRVLTIGETLAYPAVQLFFDRATKLGGVVHDEDAPIVGDMCRQLGGIALAIELAAGRVAAYGIRDTVSMLNSQFALRWPGRRTAPARHQTLHATLDWSYNLLSDAERAVLRRLSVFAGSFTLDAAQHVAGTDLGIRQIFAGVCGLVEKFLLSPGPSDAATRYRLLDTTRAYAAGKLEEAGEREVSRKNHALYYCDLLRTMCASGLTPKRLGGFAEHIDEIRAALRWAFDDGGDVLLGADIAAYSAPLWLDRGLLTECHAWMVKAAATCLEGDDAGTLQKSHIQNALATAELFTNGYSKETIADWTTTLERAESLGELPTQFLGYLIIWSGQIRAAFYADAIRTSERCIAVAAGASDRDMLTMGEWMLGHSLHHAGRFDEARCHDETYFGLETEAARFSITTIGYDRFVDGLAIYSNVLWMQGYADQCKECIDRAVAEAQAHGSAIPISLAMLWHLLAAYLMEPDAEAVEQEAVALLEQARMHQIDSDSGFAFCIMGLSQAGRGEFVAGARLAAEGIRVSSETQVEVFNTLVRAQICEVALACDRLDDAMFWMSELDRTDHDRDHWCTAEVLRIKGLLAAARGDLPQAEEQMLTAVDLARRQGSLAWELRAAMSLATLWAAQGRGNEALNALEAVYARFTEGFGTTDLLKARRLIEELKGAPDVQRY